MKLYDYIHTTMIFMQENLEYYKNQSSAPSPQFTQSASEIDHLIVQATEKNKDTINTVSHVKKIRADYRTRKNLMENKTLQMLLK
jgi:hypothetical protein